MENEYGVEEELEETLETTEQDEATENESQDEDTTSWQKNKSNWKKMHEANKTLKRELEEARWQLEQFQTWANSLYENEEDKPFQAKKEEQLSEDKVTKLEKKLFLSENKEAKEYLEDIEKIQAKYWMDLEDAWDFVKAKLPPESKTKKDFDLGQKSTQVKKNLKDVTPDEALSLSKEQKREWRKIHWFG